MDFTALPSLTAAFYEQAAARRDRNYLWSKKDGVYCPITWGEVADQIGDLARGLRDLGLQRGDRVVLVAENRPEWLIADLAIMAAGAISVPAYTTNLPNDHLHILTNSGAAGAIVSTRSLAQKLIPAVIDAPECQWVVAMEDLQQGQAGPKPIHDWQMVLERGRAQPDDLIEQAAQAKRSDTACIIYTSGTGGVPRGVMLSHGAILCNCMGAYQLLKQVGLGREVFLCFLPLSHAYEHTAGQFFPITIGAEIYYCEGVEHLLTNLGEARPTILTAVPRLYESMHLKIRRAMEKQGGLKGKLFAKAEEIGRRRYLAPEKLTLLERIQDRFLEILVRDKVRRRFGGRIKAIVSGGAALNFEIGLFFTALGLPILQGYGQTETAPVVSANPPWKTKLHTVGPPFDGVEVKIAEDGEILVRGELIMNGYWRDEAATAQVLKDGWLHTGDIGKLDEDGYLIITDRKKDIIVLSGGDNVSPARIEGILTLQAEIAQAMVYGDKRPNLVAALVPDGDFLQHWAQENRKPQDLAVLAGDADFHAALSAVVDQVNHELSPLEKIRRFTVLPESFTVENGMMTPTLKIRRHKIRDAYGSILDALYEKRLPQPESSQAGG